MRCNLIDALGSYLRQPCISLHSMRNILITPGHQTIKTTNTSWKAESCLKWFSLFSHSLNIKTNANTLAIMLNNKEETLQSGIPTM